MVRLCHQIKIELNIFFLQGFKMLTPLEAEKAKTSLFFNICTVVVLSASLTFVVLGLYFLFYMRLDAQKLVVLSADLMPRLFTANMDKLSV